MLAFSVIWLVLAATVTLLATKRKSVVADQDRGEFEAKVSANTLVLLAAVYSLALLAGFLYLTRFLISNL